MLAKLFYYAAKMLKKLRPNAVRDSWLHPSSKLESGTSFVHSNMQRHSFCGYDCEIEHTDIGSFVSIANKVVLGGGKHPLEWVSMSPAFYAGRDSIAFKASAHERPDPARISIGHDVWIGHSAIVMQGVRIGHGAVVGAGAIVTRDVPDYAIVAGNPAAIIRYRFDEATIAGLVDSAWWDMADDELINLGDKIMDVPAFLETLEQRGGQLVSYDKGND